jgi:acyl-CoA reductase-like NAD-dependent aldehyde dehydrogenase
MILFLLRNVRHILKNQGLLERVAKKIRSGFVAINEMIKSDPRLPFGEVKKSGIGERAFPLRAQGICEYKGHSG